MRTEKYKYSHCKKSKLQNMFPSSKISEQWWWLNNSQFFKKFQIIYSSVTQSLKITPLSHL